MRHPFPGPIRPISLLFRSRTSSIDLYISKLLRKDIDILKLTLV